MKALAAKRYSWRKLSSAKWGDSWLERLHFLGPARAMVIEFPGARTVRVEAHGLSEREARDLVKQFGGQVREAKWLTAVDPPLRPPIKVRSRLLIVSTEAELRTAQGQAGGTPAILIPAGMAFGTGEHATTAACLRLLADAVREFAAGWDLLDLGTGSGILALAGEALGAATVQAFDFDPHAVRTAKENLKANGSRRVKVRRQDVKEWEPERRWQIVCANLFSVLLIETAPKIARALAPDGRLIFSGILREQEEEVLSGLRGQHLEILRLVRKGKWIAGIARPLSGHAMAAPPPRGKRRSKNSLTL